MEIRVAVKDDIQKTLPLFKSFYEESIKKYFPYDEKTLLKEMDHYVEAKSALVMVEADEVVGVLAGKFVTFPMSNHKIFQETVWYVLPLWRGQGMKLFKENEKYCKSIGINSIIMGSMDNLNDDKMKRFYKSMKYECMEVQYVKKLS